MMLQISCIIISRLLSPKVQCSFRTKSGCEPEWLNSTEQVSVYKIWNIFIFSKKNIYTRIYVYPVFSLSFFLPITIDYQDVAKTVTEESCVPFILFPKGDMLHSIKVRWWRWVCVVSCHLYVHITTKVKMQNNYITTKKPYFLQLPLRFSVYNSNVFNSFSTYRTTLNT